MPSKKENDSTEEFLRRIISQELGKQNAPIIKSLKDFSERLEVVEDKQLAFRKDGEHQVILAEKFYDADLNEILEVGKIPHAIIETVVDALTLEAMNDPDVLSGRVSLARKGINYLFRVLLSAGGWNRRLGMEALISEKRGATAEAEAPFSPGEAP